MPVRIRIDVNGQLQTTLWIGRIKGKAEPDWVNRYIIDEGSETLEPWNYPGAKFEDCVQFTHRYGDGLETCVQRGLEAWNGA